MVLLTRAHDNLISASDANAPLAGGSAGQVVEHHQTWQVGPELAGKSLAAGVRVLCTISWARAKDWIEAGKLRVEGELCTDGRRPLRLGETVELELNARRPRPLLDRVAAAIVHVDEHLVVIAKPPGISTVPFEDGDRDTLDTLVQRVLARREGPGPGRRRSPRLEHLGVVHRLDRETSGLMVFARSWRAKQGLSDQFRAHTVQRHYLAIAHGQVATQTIRSHLLRDRGDGQRGSLERARGGAAKRSGRGPEAAKLAITHVELLEALPGASLVACRLETGRTHQIRIHLGELGHPLLGERAYTRDFAGPLEPAPRLMLHAAELGFRHPGTGEPVRWELPLPEDMQQVLERLRATRGRPEPPPRLAPT